MKIAYENVMTTRMFCCKLNCLWDVRVRLCPYTGVPVCVNNSICHMCNISVIKCDDIPSDSYLQTCFWIFFLTYKVTSTCCLYLMITGDGHVNTVCQTPKLFRGYWKASFLKPQLPYLHINYLLENNKLYHFRKNGYYIPG